MRTSTLVLSAALLATAAVAFWSLRELHAERARNAALTSKPELATAPRIVATAPESPPSAPAVPEPRLSTPAAVTVPPSKSPTRVEGTQEEWESHQRRMLGNPKYREAMRDQERLNFAPRRANLIRLLGFTPEQADAAIELEIERRIGWMQKPPNSEEIAAEEAAHQEKLRQLLGEPQRQRLQEYMESRPTRMQVDQFRNQLTGADALREDQIEPLIAALHVEHSWARQELRDYRDELNRQGDGVDRDQLHAEHQAKTLETMHRRMHDAASGILSRTQLEQLDAMMKRERERQAAEERMRRLRRKTE